MQLEIHAINAGQVHRCLVGRDAAEHAESAHGPEGFR
jgi:hypothetical protein